MFLRAKLLILNLILLSASSAVFAVSAEYQNNLSNLEIQKIGESSLGVTIYTDSPYKEPLQVVKKSDTEYVLLLPETSNSASGKLIEADLKSRSDGLVKSVDFKHFSYPNTGVSNGYTKVTITTSQAVGIAASAKTLPENVPVLASAEQIGAASSEVVQQQEFKSDESLVQEPEITLPEDVKTPPSLRTEFKKVQPKKVQPKQSSVPKKQTKKQSGAKKTAAAPKVVKQKNAPKNEQKTNR